MKVWIKIYRSQNTVLVAACDEELLGKRLNFKGVTIEIGDFYKGQLVEIEKALEIIANATTANLFGEKIINACIKEGLVDKEGVIYVGGVPHAQIFVIY